MAGRRRFAGLAALVFAGLAAAGAAASPRTPLAILGIEVPAGELRKARLATGETFAGDSLASPVLVAHGRRPGPVLCLTAAIHGDELNGIEVVRRVVHGLDPAAMAGTVIGVPVVNLLGFTRGSRDTPDRRDLNRYFPGRADGSFADRVAYRLFHDVIAPHCNFLVDFHTGSFNRANLPQLRANVRDPAVLEFARQFGDTPVVAKRGSRRMLRRVASEAGIPSVAFEFGAATTLQEGPVDYAERALGRAIANLGLAGTADGPTAAQPVYHQPRWVRAERGGIFLSAKPLGAMVAAGERIGVIANPLTDEEMPILAPAAGRIVGLASNQFVLPGYGVFHLGIPGEAAGGKGIRGPGLEAPRSNAH